jgi:hypothetical protein
VAKPLEAISSMLSAIIATRESEQTLVRTLAALVPGAIAGVLKEVIVADANSRDATAEVADLAGCRFVTSQGPLGERLRKAALAARRPWLMFLRAGAVPGDNWIATVESFVATAERLDRADSVGAFRAAAHASAHIGAQRPGFGEILALLAAMVGGRTPPTNGLLIGKRHYQSIGGHPDSEDAEAALLNRIGRRRVALLPCAISWTGLPVDI